MTVIDARRGTMFVVRKLVCRGDVRSEKVCKCYYVFNQKLPKRVALKIDRVMAVEYQSNVTYF